MFRISIFSDLQLHAESFNQKTNQILIIFLELYPFSSNLFDEDLELNPRAVLRMNELANSLIEFLRVLIEIYIKISKLIEYKLFSLSVFKEEKCN